MKQPTVYDGPAFHQALTSSLAQHGFQLPEAQFQQLEKYYRLLIAANNQMNLTAITAPDQAAEKHVADALHLLPLLPQEQGYQLADVGSGAGLPGLVLAIARPDVEVVLIDALAKRCRFLSETAAALGLNNVTVRHLRAEAAGRDKLLRAKCQVVTARAVAALPVLLELTLPLLAPQGLLLAMKGDKGPQELAASAPALKLLGGMVGGVCQYQLAGGEQRTILQVVQQKPCPPNYPRREGLPERQPLA